MPGVVARRVAKDVLGMWTEVHFRNGDRVMVSMGAREITLFKISKRGSLFGRECLATVNVSTLSALLGVTDANTFKELIGWGIDPIRAADTVYASKKGPAQMLDLATSLVAQSESAEEVRALDIGAALATLSPQR